MVVVAAAVAAVHANGLHGEFVFDDKGSIAQNESIRQLSPLGGVLFSAKFATVVGRPLLNLSLALNYAAGGTEVLGYHLVNVAVHALAALALFGVVRRTLTANATGPALAIALIWAVHPLQTESVSYVCQRAESMAGLFILTTLYCAIRGAAAGSSGAWTAASVAACFLAAGTKETAAAAPLLVLVHDRTFNAGTFREAVRRRPGLYAGLAASWLALGALVVSSAGRAGSAGFASGVGAFEYAATQPRAIVTYLRLAIWPHPLIFDRGAALATTAAEIVPYAVVVASLVAATVFALRARPRLGFLGAWFLLLLAPTSSFVPLATQTVAEHRMYLPLAAVVTIAVLAGRSLLRSRAALEWTAAGGVALALALATRSRNETYRRELTLWRDTVEHVPESDRAQLNYGGCLQDDGDVEGALRCFDAAIALAPRNPMAHVYRGNALHVLGRDDAAIVEFTEMLRTVPEYSAVAHDNRGVVRQAQGRQDLAIADFDEAIRIFPGYPRAYANRAVSRLASGDEAGARADVESCLRLGGIPSASLVARVGLAPK